MNWSEHFKEELSKLKETPRLFCISFVLLAAAIGQGEYSLFKGWLRQKDDLIDTLEKRLKLVEAESIERNKTKSQETGTSRLSPIARPPDAARSNRRHSRSGLVQQDSKGDHSPNIITGDSGIVQIEDTH